MKILYVVSRPLEINSSSSISNRAIIGGLLELGHEVDLVTTQPDKNHINYDNSILDDKIILNKKLKINYLNLSGIHNIARIGRKLRIPKKLWKAIYTFKSNLNIYDDLKGIINRIPEFNINDGSYDVIISSSDPKSSHLFVSKIYEKGQVYKTPWIQIWGDPFLLDITRQNKYLDYKIRKEESKLLKYATKIVYVSKLTLEMQRKIYNQYSNKMFYVPIPYVRKEIYPVNIYKKNYLKLLYCGDYSSHVRNIKPLYEAIKDSEHELIICGSSNIKLDSTKRIKIYPRVSLNKVKKFEAECDVLVHLSNLTGTQIPGKIYQYSGTNKLILFILDGEREKLYQVFNKYQRYVFCENNVDDISKAIQNIYRGVFDYTRFAVEDFSPKKIAEKIIELDR